MKKVPILPTLFTLGNVFCGLLALAKAVDGLTLSAEDPALFYRKMETACLLVFVGMVFDVLDGWVARMTGGFSDFGAQLDSLADALTFGVAPAFLAKVLVEHEGAAAGYAGSPRLHFLAAAAFSIMAMLRLARFNLESDHSKEAHRWFVGLPSPAAAGAVVSTLWLFLILNRPELEFVEGTPTPLGSLMQWLAAGALQGGGMAPWLPTALVMMLPLFGLLMVSRVQYGHGAAWLSRPDLGPFPVVVAVVFAIFLFYLAPVPILFLVFNGYAAWGVGRAFVTRRRAARIRAGKDSRGAGEAERSRRAS